MLIFRKSCLKKIISYCRQTCKEDDVIGSNASPPSAEGRVEDQKPNFAVHGIPRHTSTVYASIPKFTKFPFEYTL